MLFDDLTPEQLEFCAKWDNYPVPVATLSPMIHTVHDHIVKSGV